VGAGPGSVVRAGRATEQITARCRLHAGAEFFTTGAELTPPQAGPSSATLSGTADWSRSPPWFSAGSGPGWRRRRVRWRTCRRGEEGESWHRAGSGETRSVFETCTRAPMLIANGWTPGQPRSPAVPTASACRRRMTQRPDLYSCVVCSARCSTWSAVRTVGLANWKPASTAPLPIPSNSVAARLLAVLRGPARATAYPAAAHVFDGGHPGGHNACSQVRRGAPARHHVCGSRAPYLVSRV